MAFYLIIFMCYLIGSIPFGLLFTKWAGLGDIRAIGSGNIGATNALRTGNKKVAIATLLCDALKGYLPILALIHMGCSSAACIFPVAFVVILGHIFPVWLRFKGGKGVATTLGVYLAINPWLAFSILGVWIVTVELTKLSSLSALIAAVLSPVLAYFFVIGLPETYVQGVQTMHVVYFMAVISMVILGTHHENIRRLLSGQEK